MSYTSLPRAWYVYFFKLFLLAAGTAGLFLGPQCWPVPCQGWAGSAWSRLQLGGGRLRWPGLSYHSSGMEPEEGGSSPVDPKQAAGLGAGALPGALLSGGGQVSGLLSEGRHWDDFGSLWAAAGAHRAVVWPSGECTTPQVRLRQAEATIWGVGGSGVATTSACTESLFCDVANWDGGEIFGQLLAWSALKMKHLAPVWRAAPHLGAVAACPPSLQRLCLSLGWQVAWSPIRMKLPALYGQGFFSSLKSECIDVLIHSANAAGKLNKRWKKLHLGL